MKLLPSCCSKKRNSISIPENQPPKRIKNPSFKEFKKFGRSDIRVDIQERKVTIEVRFSPYEDIDCEGKISFELTNDPYQAEVCWMTRKKAQNYITRRPLVKDISEKDAIVEAAFQWLDNYSTTNIMVKLLITSAYMLKEKNLLWYHAIFSKQKLFQQVDFFKLAVPVSSTLTVIPKPFFEFLYSIPPKDLTLEGSFDFSQDLLDIILERADVRLVNSNIKDKHAYRLIKTWMRAKCPAFQYLEFEYTDELKNKMVGAMKKEIPQAKLWKDNPSIAEIATRIYLDREGRLHEHLPFDVNCTFQINQLAGVTPDPLPNSATLSFKHHTVKFVVTGKLEMREPSKEVVNDDQSKSRDN